MIENDVKMSCWSVAALAVWSASLPVFGDEVSGDAVIRAPVGGSEIVITTTSRLAGAVDSLTWNGKEFINSTDHGRQLQTACACGEWPGMYAEQFNPTEAGSRFDGPGEASTSQLLHLVSTDTALQTTTQMAFWLRPGERTNGLPALNEQPLSDFLVTKRISLAQHIDPHVIEYDVTVSVPVGMPHEFCHFEAVTGYMPEEFRMFRVLDPSQRRLVPLDDGPGEQPQPVVFSTESGSHAMGIFSPDQPSPGFAHAGYGRFRFTEQQVVKWNCVFRIGAEKPIEAGDYSFHCLVIVGDRSTVERSLQRLTRGQ